MRHRVSKRTFGYGVGSNTMLLRKLVTNFVMQGKLVTTHEKALYMKPSVDRLVTHAKKDTNASMNVLKSFFGVDEVVVNLKKAVKDAFAQRSSGFTRIVKIGERSSDGALMAQITWTSPVVYNQKEESKVAKPTGAKTEELKKKPLPKKATSKAKKTV